MCDWLYKLLRTKLIKNYYDKPTDFQHTAFHEVGMQTIDDFLPGDSEREITFPYNCYQA